MQQRFRSTVLTLSLLAAAPGLLPSALAAQEREASGDLVATAQAAGKFQTLLAAAKAAGLVETLQGDRPLTVFAPTDEAFDKLGAETLQALLLPENKDDLVAILTHHVVAGRVSSLAALQAKKASTLGGTELSIRLEGGRLQVGEANVIANDVAASNGVIHVIDTVLLPPRSAKVPAQPAAAAMLLLERTVEIGAPLFNEGDASACVALYENTVLALLGLARPLFDEATQSRLQTALDDAAKEDEGKAKAWALRRGIDAAYRHLSRSDAQTAAAPAATGGRQAQRLRERR